MERTADRIRPARRRGLADEVADRIREAVFSGVYQPGAQLREVELAEALGVSRGPVREALLRLEREGLVRGEWHRGTSVTAFSAEDLEELHSLREALERLAVEQAVARASDEGLQAVERAAERMARASDAHEMVRCDIAFHDAVYAAARHRLLAEAWQSIRGRVHLFMLGRMGAGVEGYLAHMPDEHRQLAAALRARDAEAAFGLFAAHRRNAFETLKAATDR
ncbi:GntR family transcriptional regulator [Segniliparus rugosus]|uniref:HTH gntR-type domain-containing protein n=1 Tax=Segniliparus rugosus (strain ATCC BAA-974 / DSM 45345 / CCUG 50838 / CIP 108380 / JCM 13579 / CDC 945) TaxID=679197 RepID=E5XN69_SEGRC|nr:GntR family transcriptional regulator [Segniliparus rugosus]EFV14200.1 hypothetical protein HMPREF9336_00939 [Segniliparus rugosus ATCC BAA-974]